MQDVNNRRNQSEGESKEGYVGTLLSVPFFCTLVLHKKIESINLKKSIQKGLEKKKVVEPHNGILFGHNKV